MRLGYLQLFRVHLHCVVAVGGRVLEGLPFTLKLGGWLGRGGAGRLGLTDGLLGGISSLVGLSGLSSLFIAAVGRGSNVLGTAAT